MQFFRYTKSIYGGQEQLVGASWDLLPWFVAAGVAFILLHAIIAAVTKQKPNQ